MDDSLKIKERQFYWLGFKTGLPFLIVIIPFGLLFGVVATEAGLDIFQTMAMTVLVIAGASQFAAAQLIAEQAPIAIVVITGLAVNLRMAMYSASIAPHIGKATHWKKILLAYFLIDQSYAASFQKFEDTPSMNVNDKLAFFFGTMTTIAPSWYLATYFGSIFGSKIPADYALDFAVPITFIALVAPFLRSLPHLAAASVSVIVSLLLVWMPLNLWLLIAALLAMITGAAIEKRIEERSQ